MVEERGSSRGNREDRGSSRGSSWGSNEDKSSHGGKGTGSSTPRTPRLQRTTAKKDRDYNADSTFEFEDDSFPLRSPGRSPMGSERIMRQQSFRVGDYEGDLEQLYKLLDIGSPAELGIKASDWEARKSQVNSRPTSPRTPSQDSGQSSDEFKGFQQPASFDSSAGSPPFSPVVPSSRPIEREWKAHRDAVKLQPVNRSGRENSPYKMSPPPPTAFPQNEKSTAINRASSGTRVTVMGRGSLTRSDGLDRRHSEPIHIIDLPTSPEALPSPSDGGGKYLKIGLSDQVEESAKRRSTSDGADLPTAAVAVSSGFRRSCVKDSPIKSVRKIQWKLKDSLEVESPANLVEEVSVGSRPANSEDSESREKASVAEIVEGPLTPSSPSMESFGSTSLKKPRWSHWDKGDFLGSGTFGTVYEGVSSDGMFFAVKEVSLSDQGKTGKQAIRQLEQEIALLSEIEHPNIVQYLGTERDDEKLYIFLELVSKGSLAHVYEKYLVKYDQVRAYTKQILSGLKYLHDRKIIHRDIKCANILVNASGVVKLADFGMAKQVDNLGRLKSFLGSAHWMAPEVINPKRSYDLMADIWSLGCTVLEMAIGKPPFGDLEAHSVLWKVGNGEGPPIPDELEEELKSFIINCLVVNAAERPTCDLLMTHPFISGAPMNGPVMLVSTHELMPSIAEERSIDMASSIVSSTTASSEVPASTSTMSNMVNNHGSIVRQQPKSVRKIRSEFSITSQESIAS